MAPESIRQNTDPPHILVVDDDPGVRLVLRAYLESTYAVDEAEEGQQALDLMIRQPVDLILLDVKMPGLSGYDLCRMLKSRTGEEFLPVLLLSALDQQESRNEGLAAGADDFLSKPVDRKELLLRTAAFLKIREQGRLINRQLADLKRVQYLKDYLFKLIVHDLRNPLASVEGYLKMMREEMAPAGDAERLLILERALAGTADLGEILESVAEVYVLEEGKRAINPELVPLAVILHEAADATREAAKRSGAEVRIGVEGDPVLMLDHRMARRCVENLIANALTYSSADDAVLVVARPLDGGAVVEVLDRGPGIPDELKGSLFEKFGSVEGWMTASRRGVGLELHLVKLVVTAHGGNVSVHDREGGGSIFRLWFPAEGPKRVNGAGK
ncbi:MAG: hybrid sensor histidine kinase/response regulator [Candidatus Wallbacteria bacterium]|nr:hybrid sensor histidine kinase/response regulator [Candidatus Wallbacteria bacterium]